MKGRRAPAPRGAVRHSPTRRLDAGLRREQLLAVATGLAASTPFDQISAEDVAAAAGVSKGLVFHYFPTTRELQVAIVRAGVARLLERLDVDPSAPPAERLLLGIDAFVAYIEEHPAGYLALARSGGSDPHLIDTFEETRAGVIAIIADAIGGGDLPPAIRIAVRGWLALVEESVLVWLDGRPVPRHQLIAFLQRAATALFPAAIGMNQGTLQPEDEVPGLSWGSPQAAGPA